MPSPSLPYQFTYVRIPANDQEPYEELTGTADKYGDHLSELLKTAFAGGEHAMPSYSKDEQPAQA